MNNRRKLILAFGACTLVAPFECFAQSATLFRIGWLSNGTPANTQFLDAFRSGMRDLGYIEGRNLVIEARFGEGSSERLDQLAAELVKLKPQVIVTQAGPATYPVVRAKPTMPVVFGFSGDPVEGKLIESYAHPGGNLTGMSYLSLELVGKRMEMLKEVIPSLKRVAIIANPHHPGEQSELRASESAAKLLGISIDYHRVSSDAELENAFAAILKSRNEAVVVFPDAYMTGKNGKIAEFSLKNRIPTISGWASFAESGNLMTYGPNLRDSFRRLATYVDKILKGAKPADLPVEQPATVEFVVNLKAAKSLGIKIPGSILVRATKVIE